MPSEKITQEEMVELFGEKMPIEAVNLLFGAPDDWTVDDVRRKLREIAALAARSAPEAGSDDLITDLRKAAFTEPEPGRHSLHLNAIEKIERLEKALHRLDDQRAPGVPALPAWACGIIRAALQQEGESDDQG